MRLKCKLPDDSGPKIMILDIGRLKLFLQMYVKQICFTPMVAVEFSTEMECAFMVNVAETL